MITSPHNEKLKTVRKLQRRRGQEGLFVAEGEDLLAAADVAGWQAVERFCAAGSGLDGLEVEPAVLATVSSLKSGSRAIAVYEERWAHEVVGELCVYLYGVGDPGNVGTVLRSARAFGASCVTIGPGTADPFGPKAVRASMGAIFEVPVVRPTELHGTTVALVPGEGSPLHVLCGSLQAMDANIRKERITLVIGAEREGLPEAIAAAADYRAHIPIANHSLNAAMAATVALYEVSRMAAA
jgi:TrmH family RNA methyltransferase